MQVRTPADDSGRRAISILGRSTLHYGDVRPLATESVTVRPRKCPESLRRWMQHCRSLAWVLLVPFGAALAETPQDPCSEEITRILGVTRVEVSSASELQTVCPTGSLERVNLTAAVGAETLLNFEFQQNAFNEAIYHLDLRDAEKRPVDWIVASPRAGEIASTGLASIELTIRPPVELLFSVQQVTVGVSIHDGSESWSRDLDLQITVGEEQPLFRDQFEIDPVIGQFSQRAQPPRRIHLISAGPAASP